MAHCHGGGFPDPLFGLPVQGDCGSAKLHDEHDFTEDERVCLGGPGFVETTCGVIEPHDEHPINTKPTLIDEETPA